MTEVADLRTPFVEDRHPTVRLFRSETLVDRLHLLLRDLLVVLPASFGHLAACVLG